MIVKTQRKEIRASEFAKAMKDVLLTGKSHLEVTNVLQDTTTTLAVMVRRKCDGIAGTFIVVVE